MNARGERIIVFGDSLSHHSSDSAPEIWDVDQGSQRQSSQPGDLLASLLAEQGAAAVRVNARVGRSAHNFFGREDAQGLLASDQAFAPTKVVVILGTNDIGLNLAVDAQDMQRIKDLYEAMGAEVWAIGPVTYNDQNLNAQAPGVVDMMQGIFGSRFIDGRPLSVQTGRAGDGVHFGSDSARATAIAFASALSITSSIFNWKTVAIGALLLVGGAMAFSYWRYGRVKLPELPGFSGAALPPGAAFLVANAAEKHRWKSGPKAFISDVYRQLKRDGSIDMSLDDFKAELVRMQRDGNVKLARADLVAAMPAKSVKASEINAGGTDYHFVALGAAELKGKKKALAVGDLVARAEAPTELYVVSTKLTGGGFRLLPYQRSGKEVVVMSMRHGKQTILTDGSSQWIAATAALKGLESLEGKTPQETVEIIRNSMRTQLKSKPIDLTQEQHAALEDIFKQGARSAAQALIDDEDELAGKKRDLSKERNLDDDYTPAMKFKHMIREPDRGIMEVAEDFALENNLKLSQVSTTLGRDGGEFELNPLYPADAPITRVSWFLNQQYPHSSSVAEYDAEISVMYNNNWIPMTGRRSARGWAKSGQEYLSVIRGSREYARKYGAATAWNIAKRLKELPSNTASLNLIQEAITLGLEDRTDEKDELYGAHKPKRPPYKPHKRYKPYPRSA